MNKNKILSVVFMILQVLFFIWLIESSGFIYGTGLFLLINLAFIGLEYMLNKEFKEWINSTVMVGIEMVERQIYKK